MLGSETRRHQYNLWCPQSLWMSLAYKGSDGTESLRYRNATILSFSVSLCEMYRTKMKLTATNTYVHTSIHDTETLRKVGSPISVLNRGSLAVKQSRWSARRLDTSMGQCRTWGLRGGSAAPQNHSTCCLRAMSVLSRSCLTVRYHHSSGDGPTCARSPCDNYSLRLADRVC